MDSLLHSCLKLPALVRSHAVEIALGRRAISTSQCLRQGHENPLGLPRSGTPPNLAARMKRGLPEKRPIPNVTKIVAVSSAKGGVGKSTVAVNLALAAARQGVATGILDTDIYGPSIPTLLGLEGLEPELDSNNRLMPLTAYGLRAMSMGFLVPQDSPIAWRGLMVQKAMNQLMFEVSWPKLDLLILDLPPGTGDVQLTIAQSLVLAGAIIISTPQDLALRDAVRGVDFFKKTNVDIFGMVQNMSSFTCTGCGQNHDIFGLDGAKKKCEQIGVNLLGDIPLHPQICSDADTGKPTVVASPEGPQSKAFTKIAQELISKLNLN
ncbi:P-loop containing nucleoside triphosphate hydrolase protein [Hortaea werneckii]|nr:P-loop containing nucleoside triphosphate hydrolase protein [Hortaea werneckii]KAI7108709.1 P-loop containing nucleoside triphosphate hydrolase protein [Hortaea werneckii]KAI7245569.1 P-loop containing nucleoside triphosphate hydrolase protein [Hortaea werneckii]KAI7328992.1 P-loop containing nucleoside triphosphate hydrolase protein [Hortaea werneckii]KAI7376442.1 P-loop containing nucleoside triphosphate hydrolase protein [Hortaea werneckii]